MQNISEKWLEHFSESKNITGTILFNLNHFQLNIIYRLKISQNIKSVSG